MHDVPAIGDAAKVAEHTLDGYRVTEKANIYGAAARGKVLARPAPANPGEDRFGRASIPDRAAQASAVNYHFVILLPEPGAAMVGRFLHMPQEYDR
jgi:hypothetical protein